MARKPDGRKPIKRDNPEQSAAFLEKAREIEADEKDSAEDRIIGGLAKQPPEPRKRQGEK
jgi:hypothetical protein